MRQCLERLPERPIGPIAIDDRKVVPPKRAEMKQSMEALIHHFKLYTEGYHVPAGEVYVATEAPRASSASIWSPTAPTSPIAARSARRASPPAGDGLHVKGHMLADVTAVLGALDIVFGEVDR